MDFLESGAAVFSLNERLAYDLPQVIEPGTYLAGFHAHGIRDVAASLSRRLEERSQLGHFTTLEHQRRASLLANQALEFYNMAHSVRQAILTGKRVEY